MVQAILSGSKTMTRRIMKPQIRCDHLSFTEAPWKNDPTTWSKSEDGGYGEGWFCSLCGNGVQYNGHGIKCPYGKIGDVLWVRETSAITVSSGPSNKLTRWYKADNPVIPPNVKFKWKPSIFMPKGSCRIKLEITGIRVERLVSISWEDCRDEGIERSSDASGHTWYKNYAEKEPYNYKDPKGSFMSLWTKINGEKSWYENPWVWVISFKKINHV